MIASGQSKTSGRSNRERLTSRSSKSSSLTRRRRSAPKTASASGEPGAPELGVPRSPKNECFEAGDAPPLRRPRSLSSCFLLPLAEETGEKQMTHAPTTQQATGNQHARQLVALT